MVTIEMRESSVKQDNTLNSNFVGMDKPRRTIKSFMRRQGYITPTQWQLLQDCWPKHGLGESNFYYAGHKYQSSGGCYVGNFSEIFGRNAPVSLEIGFGDGAALLAMALSAPEINFIGIEVYSRGVIQLLASIEEHKLSNIKIISTDAIEVLESYIPDASLAVVNVFFPDPWPKHRHHKRRLVQPEFVALVAKKLIPYGKFNLATDWHDYAQQMLTVLEAESKLKNTFGMEQFAPRLNSRIMTKFETKAMQEGRAIKDISFYRT